MIKMFIDNEEVVSDREFAINEEMLSASSTILNNCYPKSWELNKDYISNFYYPKDYSKFLLGEGEFEHGDEEYGVLNVSSETFMQYETNIEKEWNSFNVYGNTYQETRSGKNLLYVSPETRTIDSMTITKNEDGSITLNGTVSAYSYLNINLNYSDNTKNKYFTMENGQAYTLYVYGNMANLNCTVRTSSQNVQLVTTGVGNNIGTATYSGTTDTRGCAYLGIARNVQFNNVTIKPMLVKGTYTEQTIGSWEYYGQMPSPDYPSELVSVGYENLFDKDDYNLLNACYIDGTGKVVYGNNNKLTWLKLQPNTTYTITQTKVSYVTRRLALFSNDLVANAQGTLIATFTETTAIEQTFTTTDTNVYLGWVYCNLANLNNTTEQEMLDSIQITQGTQAHSYIPYGKYGIEVKTQGKNLFDKNTITLGGNWNGAIGTTCYPFGSATTRATILVPVKSNTNYYLSLKQSEWYIMQIMLSNKNYVVTENISSTVTNNTNRLITTSSDTTYIGIKFKYGSAGTTAMTSDLLKSLFLQIEEANNQTEFEEYKSNTYLYTLDNPLRSIGDTKDLLYIKNGMLYVERKIGKLILKGTENWQVSNTGTPNYIYYAYISNFKPKTTGGYSDHYKFISIGGSDTNQGIFAVPDYVRIRYGAEQSIANFKSWLTTNNVELDYLLTTPYTEVIGQVDIPYSYEGINNTTFGTGIDTEETVYYYWKNFDVLFAGIVKNSGDISLNPRYPHYCSLQILDYKTFLSESDTLDYVISNKTIREAIEMVVDSVSHYGFSLGMIDISNADDVIGAYSTLNKTAYDVLQYLADISGSRWRARYIDNSSMAIDFYEPDKLPQAEDIEYTQEYWENNNIVDLTFNYGTRDYRNKQIVLSDEVYAGIDYNEIILSNGYNTNFITSQNVGIVKEITVNGVKKDVISQQERELGADADFYYTPGKNIIESSSSYTAGTQIAVIYTPLVKGRQIVFNNDEVDRIATQTDTIGVISRYESRNDVVSSAELEKIGETYIEYKGKAEIILTLTTHNKDLFNIGEVTYFNSPIDELKQKYMVKSKETQYIIESETGNINLFYVYELTSSFNSEKAINYFDNQRNKAQGNIQEGESITRNIDINSSAVIIWGNSSIEETTISVVGDNVLNSVLNSPFIE